MPPFFASAGAVTSGLNLAPSAATFELLLELLPPLLELPELLDLLPLEPAKWAGWQSTSAAAQHLERLKQMQDQIYRILSSRSGKPLRQIIKDTKRTDLLEWNRTLGDLLARVVPFVELGAARNNLIGPFLADNEEALSVLARFADMAVSSGDFIR